MQIFIDAERIVWTYNNLMLTIFANKIISIFEVIYSKEIKVEQFCNRSTLILNLSYLLAI